MSICQSCGEELVKGAKFCIICGNTVQEQPQEKAREKTEKKGKEPVEETSGKGEVCSSCNATLREGASFCVSCGTPAEKKDQEPAKVISESLEEDLEVTGTQEEDLETTDVQEEEFEATETQEETEKPTDKTRKKDSRTTKKVQEDVEKTKGESREAEAVPLADRKDREDEKAKTIRKWAVTAGEKAAREADELDILAFGKGVVSKVAFQESWSGTKAILKGKVKCHGCNKLSIFSLETNRGWGGSNDPTTCPCGRNIEIGEYWSDADNAAYIWASLVDEEMEQEKYPLSITVSKVIEK